MSPDRAMAANGRRNERARHEAGQSPGEIRVAGAEPGDHACGPTQFLSASRRPGAIGFDGMVPEEGVEAEAVECDTPIDDSERRQELPDSWLGRERQPRVGPPLPDGAQRRNRQEDVTERSGMKYESQGRRRSSAASWRRPFVASAVPV